MSYNRPEVERLEAQSTWVKAPDLTRPAIGNPSGHRLSASQSTASFRFQNGRAVNVLRTFHQLRDSVIRNKNTVVDPRVQPTHLHIAVHLIRTDHVTAHLPPPLRSNLRSAAATALLLRRRLLLLLLVLRGWATTTSVCRQSKLHTGLCAMELRLVIQRVASSSLLSLPSKSGAVDRLRMIGAVLLLAAVAATSVGRSTSSHLITGERLSSFRFQLCLVFANLIFACFFFKLPAT
jgi:hypothetical protein